ncbi:MAG TPA: hypothetical protein VFS91_04225 [Nitrobacter sp.]|nr:hypothetical protein [Nitrobacter sp.]
MGRLFLDERNLQQIGLNYPNIETLRALTEYLNLTTTVDGHTSSLAQKQPLDADLTAIAAIVGNQGDIIYHNGAAWTDLAAGTSGHFLKTLGAGANPAWAVVASAAHRGALVSKVADQTAANYTTRTAIAWDSESYDTDSIHDTVTNNSRLTVPSGVSYVRLTGQVQILSITGGVFANLVMSKNGSGTFLGRPATLLTTDAVAVNWMNVNSPVLAVTAGDYFTLDLEIETDTSVTVSADVSWFAMEILQ